ncbi:MAG: N-acetyltransferase [Anaerolineaceae bacterium]|nr:N-acetyltransferase [Anaerolineaceae bacterium]
MSSEIIRAVRDADSSAICKIYNHYIQETCISFEEVPVSVEEMDRRIAIITPTFPFLVYDVDGEIFGYAYGNKWKDRSAYRFTAEVTVYVDKDNHGKGIGNKLLQALIDDSRSRNIHVLIAVIALPNDKSIRIHEKHGFKKVAHFAEVGYKQNRWIDVGCWELRLST